MKFKSKWLIATSFAIGALALVIWFSSEMLKCKYKETEPSYSADRRFYTQMLITLCQDRGRSHLSLVMGATGRSGKSVLLDLGPDIGEVHVSWHEGPELHVQVPESAITKRYGPYENLPRVIITNP